MHLPPSRSLNATTHMHVSGVTVFDGMNADMPRVTTMCCNFASPHQIRLPSSSTCLFLEVSKPPRCLSVCLFWESCMLHRYAVWIWTTTGRASHKRLKHEKIWFCWTRLSLATVFMSMLPLSVDRQRWGVGKCLPWDHSASVHMS